MAISHYGGETMPMRVESAAGRTSVPVAVSPSINEELRKHFVILTLLALVTFALRLHPGWLGFLPGRSGMQMLFHLNCPFCGMTRDFTGMLHGQTKTLNPSSWPFAAVVYLLYPLTFFWAWFRGRLNVFQNPITHRLIAVALVLMFIANNWRK